MTRTARALLLSALAASACAGAQRPRMVPPGDGAFVSGGAILRYHVKGEGPVCIVQPGGPGLSWEYLRLPELERSLTLVYLEPVGSGGSGRLPDTAAYTLERWAADVDALADHLGLEGFYLLGHSQGGFVAQRYAIDRGKRLRGLILVATSPRTGEAWEAAIAMGLVRFASQPWCRDAIQAMVDEASATTDEELERDLRRQMPLYVADYTRDRARIDPRVAALRASVAPQASMQVPFDFRPALRGVRAPTLVVVPEMDLFPAVLGEEIQRAVPGAERVVIAGAGHMVQWDRPQELADVVARFVARVEAR
jgi:proline iminopeptidase